MANQLKGFINSLFEQGNQMPNNLRSIQSFLLTLHLQMELAFIPGIDSIAGEESNNLVVVKADIVVPGNL